MTSARSGDSMTATRPSHRTLFAGTILENRYEILRVAGRGGMSTVYVARDLRFVQVERLCAIKEMFDVDPDQSVRALRMINFERESALLATLSHPAIPRIYDYFSFNGQIYLVLEYIDGQDLERLLSNRKSPFDEVQVVQWATEISDVLSMLHAQKPDPIIFRDLKPSNVMLRSSGQLVLVDFGIARTIQGRQRGTMIGTEGYAPPEQYRGIADARGDIYALGATLHHLVTNSDPRLETPFTFHERAVRTLNSEVSEEFSAIIMKMLAYNPVDRYQNVAALRADLDVVQRMTMVRSAPQNIAAQIPSAEHVLSVDVPPTPGTEIWEPPVEPKASKRRAARRRRQDTELLSERIVWATQTGDEVRGSATFDGHAFIIGSYDQHIYSLSSGDGAVRWKTRTGRGVVSRPAVDGDIIVVGSEDHYVYGLNRQSGTIGWSHRTGMPVRSSATIVGDNVVIGSDDRQIYCLDTLTGGLRWKVQTWGPVRSTAATYDSMLFIGSDDSYIYAIEPGSGNLVWRRTSGSPLQATPVPAGRVVVVASRGGLIQGMDAATGSSFWQYDARAAIVASPRVIGSLVVLGIADGSMVALDTDTGEVAWTSRFSNQIAATALLTATTGYVGTVDGDFVCFGLSSGDVLWRHHLGGGIVSTAAYGHGVLVVGSIDGRVYGVALDSQEIEALQEGL